MLAATRKSRCAVSELRCVQRRLSPPEVDALVAGYEAGGELARVYGIPRTMVSAHIAPAGKTRETKRITAHTAAESTLCRV